jgi:hypothetical protein
MSIPAPSENLLPLFLEWNFNLLEQVLLYALQQLSYALSGKEIKHCFSLVRHEESLTLDFLLRHPVTGVVEFKPDRRIARELDIKSKITIYPGVGHAFLNENNYDQPGSAGDSWTQTLLFLEENLMGNG